MTSEEFDKIAGEKLAAGKVSVLEKNKTEISLSLSEINLKKAYADFKIAKHL